MYARRNRVYLIEFQKDKFKKACDNARQRNKQEKLDFIKSVGLINLFTRNAQKNMLRFLTRRTFERNKMLYREGDRADRIYFVISGQFQVTKKIIVLNKDADTDTAQLEQMLNEKGKQRPTRGDFLIKHSESSN